MDITQLSEQLTSRWIAICARRGRLPYPPSDIELATVRRLIDALSTSPAETRMPVNDVSRSKIINIIQELDRQMDRYEDPNLLVRLRDRIWHFDNSFRAAPCIGSSYGKYTTSRAA
jgi:hypothetical protein